VRIVVEVSCHVVGSERRRYDAPHYHILLEGFIEERIREGRSDGGIELELKLVRNQSQGLSRIFYLSIYSFIFLPSFHPSFLHFSLSFFLFIQSSFFSVTLSSLLSFLLLMSDVSFKLSTLLSLILKSNERALYSQYIN
jgi:hypothetical protein